VTATDERAKVDHPLAALTADDVTVAVEVAKATGRLIDKPLFAYVGIQEPDKETVRNHTPGDPFDRQLRLVIVNGPDASVIEAVVSVTERAVRSWEVLEGTRPALLIEEAIRAIRALRESPDWQAALARRGIVDVEQVQIDPWPAGSFGVEHEEGRRISRCLPYYREDPTDNGYARPVEGLIGFVDMGRSEVLEIVDYGVVPLPPGRAATSPRTTSRCAPISSRSTSSSPKARASPSRGTSCAGRSGPSG